MSPASFNWARPRCSPASPLLRRVPARVSTYAIAGPLPAAVAELTSTSFPMLVVTFTEAATAELVGRIRDRLAEARRILREGATSDAVWQNLLEGSASMRGSDCAGVETALEQFDTAAVYTHPWFLPARPEAVRLRDRGALFDAELQPDVSARWCARPGGQISAPNFSMAPARHVLFARHGGVSADSRPPVVAASSAGRAGTTPVAGGRDLTSVSRTPTPRSRRQPPSDPARVRKIVASLRRRRAGQESVPTKFGMPWAPIRRAATPCSGDREPPRPGPGRGVHPGLPSPPEFPRSDVRCPRTDSSNSAKRWSIDSRARGCGPSACLAVQRTHGVVAIKDRSHPGIRRPAAPGGGGSACVRGDSWRGTPATVRRGPDRRVPGHGSCNNNGPSSKRHSPDRVHTPVSGRRSQTQAIYSSGADVFAYLRARTHADRCYSLGENWRSSSAPVER